MNSGSNDWPNKSSWTVVWKIPASHVSNSLRAARFQSSPPHGASGMASTTLNWLPRRKASSLVGRWNPRGSHCGRMRSPRKMRQEAAMRTWWRDGNPKLRSAVWFWGNPTASAPGAAQMTSTRKSRIQLAAGRENWQDWSCRTSSG